MKRQRFYLVPILMCSLLGSSSSSIAASRPKIGLVLGGGGAKAGTQIGVLRVMEELRIPVDFVVGTSMGSFIGMLYSTGYPLKEMEKILSETDWSTIFNDTTDRKLRPYRRKQDDYNYLIDYKLGVDKNGLILPQGIMGTQRVRLLIRELTLHVAHIKDFDQLPIPYRATGVDISNGAGVTLGKGELPDCVRASMSLPGIFPPVIIDGKTLVDGGSVANLPVGIAKDQKMDVVIAVDVGADFYKVEELTSFFTIIDQLTTMLTRGSTLRAYTLMGPKDVLVRPDLTGFTTESYEKIAETFGRGEQAARALIDQLKRYSVSEAEYAAFKTKRERPDRKPPMIRSVKIAEGSSYSKKVIDEAVRAKPNEVLDVKEMHRDIEHLYAFDAFEEVRYDILPEGEGDSKTLLVTPMDDHRRKNNVRLGLRVETDFKGDVNFGAAVSTYLTRLNALGGEWRNDIEIGTRLQFYSEFFQPVEPRLRYFVAPDVRIQRRTLNVFNGQTITEEDLVSFARFGFGAGRYLSNASEIRVGFQEEFGDVDQRIGTTPPPVSNYQTGRFFGKVSYDTLDNFDFPHSGVFGWLQWQQALGDLGDFSYKRYEGRYLGFLTGRRHTFALGLEGGGSLDENLPAQDLFSLGGLFRLTGYQRDELNGQYFTLTRVMYYYRLGGDKLPVLNIPAYLGGSFETGNVWNNSDDISFSSLIYAGSAFFGLDTVLGPIILGGGYGRHDRSSIYLLVGQPF